MMYGSGSYGRVAYAKQPTQIKSTTTVANFSYNGFNLFTDSIRLIRLRGFEDFKVGVTSTPTARIAGESFVRGEISVSNKSFEVVFKANSESELYRLISTAKQKLVEPDKELRIRKPDGTTMSTIATLVDADFDSNGYNVTFLPARFTFRVYDPYFYGEALYNATYFAKTASFNEFIEYTQGQYNAFPLISISFGQSLSNVDSIVVSIGDRVLAIEGSFTDSDIVVIDSKTKDVQLNSVGGQEYTGEFPELEVGRNEINVSIDGVRTADVFVQRQATYV